MPTQDAGCDNKMKIPKKCYQSKQISMHGSNKSYYYHQTSIVIDYMVKFSEHSKEWDRVPKMLKC